jgi:hypothetical protein
MHSLMLSAGKMPWVGHLTTDPERFAGSLDDAKAARFSPFDASHPRKQRAHGKSVSRRSPRCSIHSSFRHCSCSLSGCREDGHSFGADHLTELQIFVIVDSSRYSKFLTASVILLATLPAYVCTQGQAVASPSSTNIGLTSTEGVDVVDGKAEIVDSKGRRAMHLNPVPNAGDDDSTLAIFPAHDRLCGDHSVQYVSAPDYPWERLRKETPGVYESYADMETGAWTHMKILVSGTRASLYVNGAAQPCLIVNDLKLGDLPGPVALWSQSTTGVYFSNLKITR